MAKADDDMRRCRWRGPMMATEMMATEADKACVGEGAELGDVAAIGERGSRWRERGLSDAGWMWSWLRLVSVEYGNSLSCGILTRPLPDTLLARWWMIASCREKRLSLEYLVGLGWLHPVWNTLRSAFGFLHTICNLLSLKASLRRPRRCQVHGSSGCEKSRTAARRVIYT